MREEGHRLVVFLPPGGGAALQQAHIHRELVARMMNFAPVARGPAALHANWRKALRALHLKGWVAGPFLAACGTGDGHKRLICLSTV
jgi:hypothetical protein